MTVHKEFIRDTDSSLAVLMVHGIVGSPAHFKDLLTVIPEDITVHNILLDGHGKGVSDFAASSMAKWKAQVKAEVETLLSVHEKLLIVAHSMGTLLAISEAVRTHDGICELFLLSVPTRPFVRLSTMRTSLRAVFGKEGADVTRMLNDTSVTLEKKLWKYLLWIPRYAELLRETARTKKLLPKLETPTQTFQSHTDELVSARSVKDLEHHPHIKNTVLYNSGHFAYGKDDTLLLQNALKETIKRINGRE